MAKEKILVVDDEEDILELVRHHLKREGYEVQCAATGEKALQLARRESFDLIILDLMLPGMDGREVTRTLRGDPRTKHMPILMLTAKGEESDVVTGLELGADDYLTKPFSPRILVARSRAVLRRAMMEPADENAIIEVQGITIHPGRRSVTIQGAPVNLTYTEFQVLCVLARRPGWVFTRSQIVDLVRGDDYPVTDRSVDVQIVGLRKKLGEFGSLIETVRGVGYRFADVP
jgi:two-component system alkaline phosphatase synthesis response regulator PhoP